MRMLIGLTIAVGAVWLIAISVDMFNQNYDPPAMLGTVFMAIVSGLLGVIAAEKARDNSKRDNKKDDDHQDDDGAES